MASLSSPPNAYKIKKLNSYYDNLTKNIDFRFYTNSILSSSSLINLIEDQTAFFINNKVLSSPIKRKKSTIF